jgi:hypothetical protein
MPIVLKSRSLNLLEPSGPVQACNGIALPLFTLHRSLLTFILCMYFYDHISLNYPQNENVSDKVCSGNQNPNLIANVFSPKILSFAGKMGKNMEQLVRQAADNTIIGHRTKTGTRS